MRSARKRCAARSPDATARAHTGSHAAAAHTVGSPNPPPRRSVDMGGGIGFESIPENPGHTRLTPPPPGFAQQQQLHGGGGTLLRGPSPLLRCYFWGI